MEDTATFEPGSDAGDGAAFDEPSGRVVDTAASATGADSSHATVAMATTASSETDAMPISCSVLDVQSHPSPSSSSAGGDALLPEGKTVSGPGPGRPSRSSEAREVHHVTFAEHCNKYVHSDSGIVLSPDDSDLNDVTVECPGDLSDNEGGDAVEGVDTGQRRCLGRLPAGTKALPGPPIIKLHRRQSTDSQDNPFLSDGELSRKADYIITHSTILRSYVRIADPDQIHELDVDRTSVEVTANEPLRDDLSSGGQAVSEAPPLVPPTESHSPPKSSTPQRAVTSKEPVRNGDAEEPLLAGKHENSAEATRRREKEQRSRKRICCIIQ